MEKANSDIEEKEIVIVRKRVLTGTIRIILKYLCIIMSIYQLYIGLFGAPFSLRNRPIHLMFVLVILFLLYPSPKQNIDKDNIPFFDYILILLSISSAGYLILSAERVISRIPYVTKLTSGEFTFGIIMTLIVLIASYRVIGKSLFFVTTFFILYGVIGRYLPAPFWHKGYSAERIIEQIYLTLDGIWGLAIHITSTFVFLFILFGTFLVVTGAGEFFTNLAYALTKRTIGGSAKTAVVASSLMGTLSGSSTANVVTTGAFTIPMMKKAGYPSYFAGAVESVASTGGQIVPPVMGAAGFIMAEFTGIPYIHIMKYALVPAFFYYFSLYIMVHIRSAKFGVKKVVKPGAPTLKETILSQGYLFIPVLGIIYFLMKGYTPLKAALYAIFLLLILVFIASKDKIKILKFIPDALEEAPKVVIPVSIACACAGIIVGMISLTGLGYRITSIILYIGHGILPIVLILAMILAIILGMGMPTSSAYIIMAALLAPALIKMNVALISAHMFIFYFGALSSITPPVALASYAGAGLANAPVGKTSYAAFKLAYAGYIVPYIFVYNPSLLISGSFFNIIIVFIKTMLGIVALSIILEGWFGGKNTTLLEKCILLFGVFLLVFPSTSISIISIALMMLYFLYNKNKLKSPVRA